MPTLSYALILSHCAEAISDFSTSVPADGVSLKLTLDFPPERSETRAGTLVSRFENNLNFAEKLLSSLGGSVSSAQRVGPSVEICDNVNPQGGGEYLTDDEVMIGLRSSLPALGGRTVTVLLNAGVDADTLKQVREHDKDEGGVVVLVNCGVERLSWFAKLGGFGEYIERFRPAYYLKNIAGNGWLLKKGTRPWMVFADAGKGKGPDLVYEIEERPKIVDVEAEIRLAIAGIPRKG